MTGDKPTKPTPEDVAHFCVWAKTSGITWGAYSFATIEEHIADAIRSRDQALAAAMGHLEAVTGDLAEHLAEDMDHANKDHSKWYRKVRKARAFLAQAQASQPSGVSK